jgi:Protein of unknown function (DUF3108)
VPVFDGSTLYNLRSIDVARQTLSADDHQKFAGSSQVCEVRREDLSAAPNQDESTYQGGKIWYTRLIAGEMTPVRMEFTTAFGVVKAYLAQLWGRRRRPPFHARVRERVSGAVFNFQKKA